MIRWLAKGLPRQFWVMWQNNRCSILFHLLVPGGKWLTTSVRPVLSASFCSAAFHSRARLPLLPPPSAVTYSCRAFGSRGRGPPAVCPGGATPVHHCGNPRPIPSFSCPPRSPVGGVSGTPSFAR